MTNAHAGDKALKSLLIYSCNSFVKTINRLGGHYDRYIARERLKVIQAIVSAKMPYAELLARRRC